MEIFSYFILDDVTYKDKNLILYTLDYSKREQFVEDCLLPFRQLLLDDIVIEENEKQGILRSEIISSVVPSDPIIKAGDFGEMLAYYIFSSLYPQATLRPKKWQWKEDKNRAAHFSDMIMFVCPDYNRPQITDSVITAEIKTRATQPRNGESSIRNAINGSIKDIHERYGKTLAYLKGWYIRQMRVEDVKVIHRFEDPVEVPYSKSFNAAAIVDEAYFVNYHMANLTDDLLQKVANLNVELSQTNSSFSIYVIPIKELKALYETIFQKMINS